ncbi:MAG: CPBP family intramembrane metalloprotease [Bacteroidales bacterium]|jgi:membrane protease YdiL (CAAX protease family)|nr:CPBP family intramembrane metalloprotease [Bacteroidales bacterium]MCB9028094.1 CPBP family intramembrane metalloprotease [Bacteroidales bacterium]MDD3735624.1 CPBP family intramembrane metalloprotease [Bacteroidales bacterium]HNT92530.1 CPBP family intramembrane metalloprotease [Bacteroidales bacterium]HOO66794.1 CPBP family intramembrane metalloprotease [Bacteroidales bacterium]
MEYNETIFPSEETMDTPFMTAPFRGKNAFWRYFVGVVAPFIAANVIGALPLAAVIITRTLEGSPMPQKGGMPDFEAMGINLNVGFVLNIIPFLLGLLTIILLVKPLHNRSFQTVVNGGRKTRWGRVFMAALVWIVVSAVWMIYSLKSDPGNFRINNTSTSLIVLAILALTLIPFQAAFEEILFRGYLMQGFAVLARNRWIPIVVTSLLFGLMHGLNPEVQQYGFLTMMPQYIFFGLVFAVLTMFDDGIEMAIGAHAANNIFLSVLITHDDMALQTPALYEQVQIYPWKEFAGLVVMSVVFLVIMAIICRWKDIRKLYARIIVPVVAPEVSDAVDAG